MIDLISRVNPNYQKSIDAVSGAKPAERTEKPADEAEIGRASCRERVEVIV